MLDIKIDAVKKWVTQSQLNAITLELIPPILLNRSPWDTRESKFNCLGTNYSCLTKTVIAYIIYTNDYTIESTVKMRSQLYYMFNIFLGNAHVSCKKS